MQRTALTILISIFYIAGITGYLTGLVIPCALACAGVLIFAVLKEKIAPKRAMIIYLFFAIALLNCHFQIKNSDALSKLAPSKGTISGTIISIPTTNKPESTKFYLKVKSAEFGKEKYENLNSKTIVTIKDRRENYEKLKIGDNIEVTGKLRQPVKALNPSQFDYRKYLKYNKTFSTFYANAGYWKIASEPDSFGWSFLQNLNNKRQEIINIHKKYMKSPNIEVLGGIVFGDDAINPPDYIRHSFINSGLLHILAASGMNVSIIFGIWFFIGSRLRLNFRLNILIGAGLVLVYTLMTGMGASVLRAALMIEFVLFGKLIDRNADGVALLFFVALVLLLYNPAMIMEVGFQLSFLVTFALMYICPPVLGRIENKIAEFLGGTVLIPMVAQFWAAPIQMFYFNNFATYSILANILITPFIMIISFLGFAASILAMIPPVADRVCMLFDFILNPVVSGLVNISDFFSNLPHSLLITPHPGLIQIGFYYGALLSIGYLIRKGEKNIKWMAISLVVLVIFGLSLIKFDNGKCEILAFSVGNADSFLIKTPQKQYVLIDTSHGAFGGGFSQADAIINKYLKDNGIKLDLMILTHFDSDHSGGAVDVLKVIKTKKVLITENKPDTKTAHALMDYLNSEKVDYSIAKNNEIVLKESDLTVTTYVSHIKENDNENSVITLLKYKDFDMLFMGDGSTRSYGKIKSGLPPDIDILKVGHHGAKNTVNREMLKNTEFAVISTGFNAYGHPAPVTMNKLRENGVGILRTDSLNALKIATDGENYRIFSYNPDKKQFKKLLSQTAH